MDHINKEVFKEKLIVCPSFFQILFGKKPKINAIIEINNLLSNKHIQNIDPEEIINIADEYNINLKKKFEKELFGMYKSYLDKCLEDKFLSHHELADLKHLKNILLLNDCDINRLNQEATGEIFKTEVALAVNDGTLDTHEKLVLNHLQSELRLTEEHANKIYEEGANEIITRFINQAISDERLCPNEEKELEKLIKSLNINPNFDEPTKSVLDKYKLLWQIENGILPNLSEDFSFSSNEKCYYKVNTKWVSHEVSDVDCEKKRGLTNLKISKKEHLVANSCPYPMNNGQKERLESGEIYLTNLRLILKTESKIESLYLKNLCLFNSFKDIIEIHFHSIKLLIMIDKNSDIFSLLLGKAIEVE